MEAFFSAGGHQLSSTHFYRGESLPPISSFDCLIIMGGPMGVGDHIDHPWLEKEIAFLGQALNSGKTVLGICLGAQLIAAALGARVRKNPDREIGWFPVQREAAAGQTLLAEILPQQMQAFHWHGDTFELPTGAHLLASSEACANQAFSLEDRIFGFQFHLETTLEGAEALISHCSDEIDGSRYVQTAGQMLRDSKRFTASNRQLDAILEKILDASSTP